MSPVDIARRDAVKAAALAPLLLLLKGTPDMAGSSWTDQLVSLILLAAQQAGFSGFFSYTPAPGFGNLRVSIAAQPGTDPSGNAYLGNVTAYNATGTGAVSLSGGQLIYYTSPGPGGPWSNQGGLSFNAALSELFIGIGQVEFNSSLVTFDGAVTVIGNETVNGNFHVGGGTMPQGAVSGFPVSGSATLATVITALNNLHNAGVAAGVWG